MSPNSKKIFFSLRISINPFFLEAVGGGVVAGHDEKKTQITQMRLTALLRSSHFLNAALARPEPGGCSLLSQTQLKMLAK
ncbi:MAG TPA: hypothetical protein O0X18_07235, partial [Methanocorpusculum sp.]|nr:hypothetical protein [Methanocorpusculum sp.]